MDIPPGYERCVYRWDTYPGMKGVCTTVYIYPGMRRVCTTVIVSSQWLERRDVHNGDSLLPGYRGMCPMVTVSSLVDGRMCTTVTVSSLLDGGRDVHNGDSLFPVGCRSEG